MNWFQPNASSITDLSIACIELVFLVYLLRLKNKSRDCYLVIWIYSTLFPLEVVAFFIEFQDDPPLFLWVGLFLCDHLHILAVLWCSYRFYSNPFPRESVLVSSIYLMLCGVVSFLWLRDYFLYHQITTLHALNRPVLYGVVILLAAINYLRKKRLNPTGKPAALFRGFAISLFLYALTNLLVFLLVFDYISYTALSIINYVLSVSITVVVSVAYFNYAAEKNSFEAKLVGFTLFLTLGVVSLIPLLLFGAQLAPATVPYLKVFVWVVPVTTLLISVFLPLLLRLTILRDLHKVIKGVRQVIDGDLGAKVAVEVNDEIGGLSEHFNQMTSSIRQRTEQLDNMRESIATDFHDQTGNMLSSITRQAGLLKLKLSREHEVQPIIESIVQNSNNLYASSKDFLWQMNHNTDDPQELFDYLTSHGQTYYNQFDIAFSGEAEDCRPAKVEPSAALHLIYIFKEAMTNVAKHAGANEVSLTMACATDRVVYTLADDGSWKEPDTGREHYGLSNMQRRCEKHGLTFNLLTSATGTQVTIGIPTGEATHQL